MYALQMLELESNKETKSSDEQSVGTERNNLLQQR